VPARIVTWLSTIDFGRSSEALYCDQMPGLLTELADRARVLSITASPAIEGIIVADADRAQRVINRQATTLRADRLASLWQIGHGTIGRSATIISAERAST
jgi:hypothetical protein